MDTSASPPAGESRLPTLRLDRDWNWQDLPAGDLRGPLEAALAQAIARRRWFGAKMRSLESLSIVDAIPLAPDARLLIVDIRYQRGAGETYQIPLAMADRDAAALDGAALWAHLEMPGGKRAVLYDPLGQKAFSDALLTLCASQQNVSGAAGELRGWSTDLFATLRGPVDQQLPARLVASEQSNSSIAFDQRLILKVFRRVEHGLNPDLEITQFLSARRFAHVASLAGAYEYRPAGEAPWTLGILQAFVPNRGDAWTYTLEQLRHILAQAAERSSGDASDSVPPARDLARAAREPIPSAVRARFADYLPQAELLGKRTAQLHVALSAGADDPAFAPEPISAGDRRRSAEIASKLARETFEQLRQRLPELQGEVRRHAEAVLWMQAEPLRRSQASSSEPIDAAKIRIHGDYHLGQVLVTDGDFVIIDFEGEPARRLDQRRQKQPALRDVAGMIRSFHYASCSAAAANKHAAGNSAEAERVGQACAEWYFWTSAAFLSAYCDAAAGAVFQPRSHEQFDRLLAECLLEKAVYELRYELNNRPDWVYLPLAALHDLLADKAH
jgi:trehalose synthase-fused probable maltokinase